MSQTSPKRSAAEQEAHDQIVEILAQRLREEGFTDVRANPGAGQTHEIQLGDQVVYPDVFTLEEGQVINVFEVETAGTVAEESVDRWRTYAKAGKSFFLVVPEEMAEEAKRLLATHQVSYQSIFVY